MDLFKELEFYVNYSQVPSNDEAELMLGDILADALQAYYRLKRALPRMMSGMDQQVDEESRRNMPFLFYVVDQACGVKLFSDHARCFYSDERGDEVNQIEYGPRIHYVEADFVEQVRHQLSHAVEAAIDAGTVTCPDCGASINLPVAAEAA